MGPEYWLITLNQKDVIEEDKLDGCEEIEKYIHVEHDFQRGIIIISS